MKVYVVTSGTYADTIIEGVFSTDAIARAASVEIAQASRDQVEVLDFELDRLQGWGLQRDPFAQARFRSVLDQADVRPCRPDPTKPDETGSAA